MAGTTERDQKTEQPTAKKLADSAREGDVLMSKELATALMMLAGAGWLFAAGGWLVQSAGELLKRGLTLGADDVAHFAPGEALMRNGVEILLPLSSLFALALVASVAAPAMLGSLGWRGKAIAFKGNRMNPLSGIKRIFGPQGLIELVKSLAKVLLLGTIGYWLVANSLPAIMSMAQADLNGAIGLAGKSVGHAMLAMAGGLVVIALIDVPAQWYQRNRRLMMSKQEVKQEMRESDGAPELKQAQRQRQHEILSGSARKAVAEATVVLTNPTHFSVALRYRPGQDAAPVVVARGRGDVALSIRELARGAHVPILEYPALTRAIYFTARAGRAIPEELFVAVATVLAFVFQLERAVAEGLSKPSVDVPPSHRFDLEGRRQN
ncbi:MULTISPECIES: flagellar type III secretion system protein FlhB [unclassified Sphingopyxis]|uniref:flagellar type III secretion system protein FlhB n=1 Tax=unclassified Sphingopyxis TaxID=2614943 RepID=UPI00072FB000|nr:MULTISPECIES: flagellar type III secretion system protein FlhB [unclassified Sphingopyxis]KTE20356.1 flagellar biosynthesis protein FlhB [Sphingopyxis sp. H057]KTE49004.1 flagellar biosynthesis protein FlhB [Sphingopyxis sp. H073]KTE53234.1 flagellar biosynthesis protein FlhB [Sphingopyxis sp. H071]KTE57898.1 flagellar biosynthesis protein FlhB [Sphingopyxis sp. H107]KTE61645.1 flagellar biosynthesis protein FlhB [Sphingopyxis sp. H100]